MKTASTVAMFVGLVASSGCGIGRRPRVETRPYPVSATAAIERYQLVVPARFEIRGANYSVAALANVTGHDGTTDSEVELRPLVTVFAVDRKTGEQFILVYEDLAQRQQPSQIIGLVAARDSAGGEK